MAKATNMARDDKPFQVTDLDREHQGYLGRSFSDAHANAKDRSKQFVEMGKGKDNIRKSVSDVTPFVKNKKVTIASAAKNRVTHVVGAASSEENRHSGEQFSGAGWYFNHHGDIDKAAKAHGFDTNRAITASAVMSPQNSPDNEKAAVSALMRAHTSGSVQMTPELHAHLASKGLEVDPGMKGQSVPVKALSSHVVAQLSDPKTRHLVHGENFGAKEIARGGSRGAITKANEVLRGNISESDALDPHSAPKVFSYRDAIRDAVPNTAEHHEYMARAAHLADVIRGDVSVHQPMLDHYGLRDSKQGMLDPHRSTAEDTWMNSISTGQANHVIDGGRANVMKTVGSAVNNAARKGRGSESVSPDARVSSSAVLHAGNNAATIHAGSALSRSYQLGYHVPSVLVQETAWTHARREGGKDPAFNQANANVGKQFKAESPHPYDEGVNQDRLF